MTLYRIYAENGHRAGFWVQHRTWQNVCAQIQTIAGNDAGPLPGAAPNHNHAPIEMQMFDVRSGRPLHDHPASAADPIFPAAFTDSELSAAPIVAAPASDSTAPRAPDRHYTRIAEPFWYDAYAHKTGNASHARPRVHGH
jgi:hypothetical protein